MPTANGTFVVEKWDQDEPYEDGEAGKLSRAHVSKRFSDDFEATSATEIMMINTRQAGSDAYVALELVTGTLHGKSGSFVLQHSAVQSGDESSLRWTSSPDRAPAGSVASGVPAPSPSRPTGPTVTPSTTTSADLR